MNGAPTGGSSTVRAFSMPQPGDVIGGKYAIVRVLGEGGMGIVYEATHQRLRQRVAVKMLLPAMLEHEVLVSRFDREARAAAQLRGRHCARVKDVDVTADGLPYMVMDFLEGHDLQVELERRGQLPIAEGVDYVLQACAAMVEAHQLGIVHRDLKPSNLFLEAEGGGHVVKVLDFGISKVANDGDTKLTDANSVVGTAMYMSPEQIRASHSVDARADIWALGVILYEALAGRVPWIGPPTQVAAMIVTEDAPDLRTLCAVPADLAAIIHKTLQRDPNNRFADVKELVMALAPFAPGGSTGRSFAENVVASGSYPRVAITPSGPRIDSSPGLAPKREMGIAENAKTMVNAPVAVGAIAHETGTAPGWAELPASPLRRGRAALVGALIAIVITVLSIGGVLLFARRQPKVGAAAAEPTVVESATTPPVPTTQTATSSTALHEPAPPPTMRASAVASTTTRPASPVRPPATPGVPKPSASPKTTPSSDRPLFL